MKNLLFKLFPKFFKVNITNYIDTKTMMGGDKKFLVYHIDLEAEYMHGGLGITEERVAELSKNIKNVIKNSDNTIDAMVQLEPYINHANEFYLVSIMLYTQIQKSSNGLNGLAALIEGLRPLGGGPSKD